MKDSLRNLQFDQLTTSSSLPAALDLFLHTLLKYFAPSEFEINELQGLRKMK
jgi:hypothetical protein